MPILATNAPELGDTGEDYVSPFPSGESLASEKFTALLEQVAKVTGDPEGATSRMQAQAWDRSQRVLMRARFTSPFAGGIRTDWLPRVAAVVRVGQSDVVRGLFADPPFPVSTDSKKLLSAAGQVGLVAAQGVLTAVPIVNTVMRAAVGVGRFFWRLANADEEQRELEVPWQTFTRATDEDAINQLVRPLMQGTDWTPLFFPALEAGDFRMEGTDKGGHTRAFGVFSPSGEPRAGAGFGFQPGTEQMTDVVQIANAYKGTTDRRDVRSDVGSFWPSVSQFATGAWAMAQQAGNPDMYKVRAGELGDAWSEYYDALFSGGFDQYDGYGVNQWEDRLYLSKLLARFVVVKQKAFTQFGLTTDDLGNPYVTPEIFSDSFVPLAQGATYHRPDDFFILPATRALKQRQKSMLARTVVCALVRPTEVGNLPPFAAFLDKSAPLSAGFDTFGDELVAYCLEMRAELLKHAARYELAHLVPGSNKF